MNKNTTVRMGNYNHHHYLLHLVGLVRTGGFNSAEAITEDQPLTDAMTAYKASGTRAR